MTIGTHGKFVHSGAYLLFVIMTLLVGAVAPVAAASPPSLGGERLIVSNSFGAVGETYDGTMNGSFACDPGGTSTLEVSVAGNAYGTYPGTFTQTATVEESGGALLSFDVTFEIVSGATTVTGTATYSPTGADVTCEVIVEDEETFYLFSAGSGAGGGNAEVLLDYSATVTSLGGTTADHGVVDASVFFYCAGAPDIDMAIWPTSTCPANSSVLRFIILAPTSLGQCMKGGWQTFNNPTFKNQGDCVSFVVTHGKNGPNG